MSPGWVQGPQAWQGWQQPCHRLLTSAVNLAPHPAPGWDSLGVTGVCKMPGGAGDRSPHAQGDGQHCRQEQAGVPPRVGSCSTLPTRVVPSPPGGLQLPAQLQYSLGVNKPGPAASSGALCERCGGSPAVGGGHTLCTGAARPPRPPGGSSTGATGPIPQGEI